MVAALEQILERAVPLEAEPVSLDAAAGRVLASGARACVDLPPFPSSAMDGFVLRSVDTPGTLPIVFRIAAGRPSPRVLERGEAMEISTGGVVPVGADAVVPLEQAVADAGRVRIEAAAAGAHVRPRGGDLRRGDLVAAAGIRLGAGQLGALAAAGLERVACARRPRAALLSTGTELRPPGAVLGDGEIYDANGVMLAAALASAGAEVERLGPVSDDEGAHREALERGLAADVLVTSGGVSVGSHDLVRRVAGELGVEEVFWGVAVKPGKPLSFGVRDATLVFGLPGNPVSSLVAFELFVRPALAALQGLEDPGPHFRRGRADRPLRRNPHRDELLRARSFERDGEVVLDPVGGQESHMIARAASADTLALVPRGEGELAGGTSVRYLPF